MKRTQTTLFAALALMVVAPAGLAQAITLDMPFDAVPSAGATETLGSYALPIARYSNGVLPTRMVEGPLRQMAWKVAAPGATTLEILQPLRAQLHQAGFRTVFECEAVACGGFDFRYGTVILPEPEMHVDLGDYRFFAAERGAEVVSLMVSRAAAAGFVQMIHVGGALSDGPLLNASSMAAPEAQAAARPVVAPDKPQVDPARTADLGDRLISGGAVALDDLVFASGSSALVDGTYASLRDLAKWLKQNPSLSIALVGHTDASGGLEGNITLSRKRAEAVLEYLVRVEGVPAAQLEAQGVGYLSPRTTNLTPEGREKNRRVEVMVTSTQGTP